MTAPLSAPSQHQRLLGPAFDALSPGLILVGAPSAVGKTCVSLSLAAHYAAHLGEMVLYISPGTLKEIVVTRLAKNLTPDGSTVDPSVTAGLPLVVMDAPEPTSAELLEAATSFVEQHGQPGLVLVNDLQNLRPGKEGLTGLAAAIEIMADLRGISKVCDAPLVLFSQLTPGKGVAKAVAEQADRVIVLGLKSEDPQTKHLEVSFFDPPEPEASRYDLVLTRSTGVVGIPG
jgi:hypothetical protein